MIAFPNAKINLGLNILSKREDGYHNISSCFVPIGWRDILEIIPSKSFEFTSSGLTIPGSIETNLCVKAFHLLQQKYDIPNVKMHLHKVIPMGAGLGGGSADGAFALKMLNEYFSVNLTVQELESIATKLGADCPFFIQNKSTLVSGIGEIFEPIQLNLESIKVVVIYPAIHINTKLAFSKITPHLPQLSVKSIIASPRETWTDVLINDFEEPVFDEHPALKVLKSQLYESGAFYASMTGSGSSIFGLFDANIDLQKYLKNWSGYEVWTGELTA